MRRPVRVVKEVVVVVVIDVIVVVVVALVVVGGVGVVVVVVVVVVVAFRIVDLVFVRDMCSGNCVHTCKAVIMKPFKIESPRKVIFFCSKA